MKISGCLQNVRLTNNENINIHVQGANIYFCQRSEPICALKCVTSALHDLQSLVNRYCYFYSCCDWLPGKAVRYSCQLSRILMAASNFKSFRRHLSGRHLTDTYLRLLACICQQKQKMSNNLLVESYLRCGNSKCVTSELFNYYIENTGDLITICVASIKQMFFWFSF